MGTRTRAVVWSDWQMDMLSVPLVGEMFKFSDHIVDNTHTVD